MNKSALANVLLAFVLVALGFIGGILITREACSRYRISIANLDKHNYFMVDGWSGRVEVLSSEGWRLLGKNVPHQ